MKNTDIKFFKKIHKEFLKIKKRNIKIDRIKPFFYFDVCCFFMLPLVIFLTSFTIAFLVADFDFNKVVNNFNLLIPVLSLVTFPLPYFFYSLIKNTFLIKFFDKKVIENIKNKKKLSIKNFLIQEIKNNKYDELKDILQLKNYSFLDVFKFYLKNMTDKEFIENDKELFLLFKDFKNININNFDQLFQNKYLKLFKNEVININTIENRIQFYSDTLNDDLDRKESYFTAFHKTINTVRESQNKLNLDQSIKNFKQNTKENISF
tara:strand:+ start:5402 stop:6190 length:789 start_codon:yes stop_codon:yes gene_type:complete